MKKRNRKFKWFIIIIVFLFIVIVIPSIHTITGKSVLEVATNAIDNFKKSRAKTTEVSFDLDSIPEFTDKPYVVINDNKPDFEESDFTNKAFEKYSKLDALGRCGVAYANICKELMPKSPREEIGMIKPSGWKYEKYDFIDGKYLYNRCHLIGFQLAGENANEKNLITGTRYLNVQGMLPFENEVAEYVRKTNNHVLYRVTPIFKDKNLIASGVQMEAMSVEDRGKSICFNVYVYNNQPRVEIDYKTGKSKLITN